ncbi:uncharacterized protein LOC126896034 [Daktulosphaira vitifoliae]|uniref:uncharacterized protein LOC126896034 n=1 Tax=Daktulosphaira vitifoliae TaxID=58002 RepID=UPI0021AA5EFE|nr:uncharacterized protein LOC126896034 [Daktulosphaira vitifoliae]
MFSHNYIMFSLVNLIVLMSLTLVHCTVKINEDRSQLNTFLTLKNISNHQRNDGVQLQFARPYFSPFNITTKQSEDTVQIFFTPIPEKMYRHNETVYETPTPKNLTFMKNQPTERIYITSKTPIYSTTPVIYNTKQDSLENHQTDFNNFKVKHQLKTYRAQQLLYATTVRPINNVTELTLSTTSKLVTGSKPFTMVMVPKQILNNITPTIKPDLFRAIPSIPQQNFKRQSLDTKNNSESHRAASISSLNQQTIVTSRISGVQKQPYSIYKSKNSDFRDDIQTYGNSIRRTVPEASYKPILYAQSPNLKETYEYPTKSVTFKVDQPTFYVTETTRMFYPSTDKPSLKLPISKYPSNDNTKPEIEMEYIPNLSNWHSAKSTIDTEQDQYYTSNEPKDMFRLLLEDLLKSKYKSEMKLKRNGLDEIMDQYYKNNKHTPEYIEDYEIDTEMNCNLRSTRHITDGRCTSTQPIEEAVCAERCLVYTSAISLMKRLKSTSTHKQQVEALHCVNGDTKLLRVKLLCQDGAVLNNVVKVITNCRCKLHPVQPQIRNINLGLIIPQVDSEINDQY